MASTKGTTQNRTSGRPAGATGREQATGSGNGGKAHEHRTAKVVELVCSSKKGFDDAIRNALQDASATTRGITGAHVENLSVRCVEGRIVEYKVNLKVAFGIERTRAP